MDTENQHASARMVHLPAPTAMPIALAMGVVLLGAGLVTSWVISALGLVLMIYASVGWFRQVLPHESHEDVPVITQVVVIESSRTQVARLPVGGNHRKILPLETFTFTAGVKGGIAGGIAMVGPAALYGLIRYHSVWYAPNLLAALAFPGWSAKSVGFLTAFHLDGLLVALGVHALASVLVGLLYGAILPMFPRKPILTAGFLAPIFWTGLLYGTLEVVNPILNRRIDWLWFIISQIAFGLVAGFVVNLHVRVRTTQFQSLPFFMRAGVESMGMDDRDHEKDSSR